MVSAAQVAVEVDGLSKRYGTLEAVRSVSFAVERGEVFALLGPNGAGKTTTVEILEGFRSRDAGTVSVLGHDPSGRPRALRERLGIVLQELAVEPNLTVREVLTRNAGYYPSPRPVDEVIALVGLEGKASSRIARLSGGQQRRLDVGLGIIGRPELIFLDEPTTGFDPSARRGAWDLVRALQEGGTTIILTTHYMDEAEALADRVAVIARGQIVALGPPSSIGGRDVSEATIRFRMPPGVAASDLPVPARAIGEFAELTSADEIESLHRLTGWALERALPLTGLTVERLTLEDVYLRLTAGSDGAGSIGAPTEQLSASVGGRR
ncbi:MAG: ABC transporter ATP-binding protein [Actinomycetota bacterium]|nr:ABC transporter ATP-binding protein [Actinomycetota bacterium]